MGKTCTHEFFKNAQIALVLRTRAILYVFEKLTRACFSQIALETILLPIHIEYLFRRGQPPPPRYGNWKVTMELENYQRKFTKLIKGLEDLSSEIDLGLTTLERRTRRDLIEIFKIESDFVAYDQHMFRKGSSGRQFLLTPASSSQDPFKCRSTML